MRIKNDTWTKEQEQYLILNYPFLGPEMCSKKLNRTKTSIVQKAFSLQIKYDRYRQYRNLTKKFCSKCKIEKDIEMFQVFKKSNNKTANHSQCKECRKSYYRKNKEKISKERKERRKTDPSIAQYFREYRKKRAERDPEFKLRANMSRRVLALLRNSFTIKTEKTSILIGCSGKELKIHLESLFEDGMTWGNYGLKGWHVDHLIPAALFDLTKKEDQLKCFHFSNLAPRWATTEIARKYGSNREGNIDKLNHLVDDSYYHLLENPS